MIEIYNKGSYTYFLRNKKQKVLTFDGSINDEDNDQEGKGNVRG